MITITEEVYTENLSHILQGSLLNPDCVALWWLGQAGFAIKSDNLLILIDPYLSDFLARKYQGKEFPHIRMMASPIFPDEVHKLNLVLCTHRHSDHMDPETLPILSQNNPDCLFVIPKSERTWGIQLGLPQQQMIPVNAGERIAPLEGISVDVIPAAHEEFKSNADGEHHYLGYILTVGGVTIYHSGDCCPYPGLEAELQNRQIDIALLPINGRDAYRRSRNVPGNFTLVEAVELCKTGDIPIMIGHHFGMFEFNTVNVDDTEHELQHIRGNKQYSLAKIGVQYSLSS